MLRRMTREPQKTTAFGPAELKSLLRSVNAWAEVVTLAVAYVESKPTELWVFKAPTLERGLNCMDQFTDALKESLNAATSGKPYNEDTSKTRGKSSAVAAEEKTRYKRDK